VPLATPFLLYFYFQRHGFLRIRKIISGFSTLKKKLGNAAVEETKVAVYSELHKNYIITVSVRV